MGQLERCEYTNRVDQGSQERGGGVSKQGNEPNPHRSTDDATDRGQQREFGVCLDQFVFARTDRRHERGARDAVSLLQNEHREGFGEEQQAVDVATHQEREDHAQRKRANDHATTPASSAIDRRSKKWRNDRKRGDGQYEVKGDPPASVGWVDRILDLSLIHI